MRISETFTSIQGEGHLTGKRMHFVRAQGCSVSCPIREVCDQPESLGEGGIERTPDELAEECLRAVGRGGWVCLTGGEPTEQDDFEWVCEAIRRAGLLLHIQTSGTRRVNAQWDWLTVSPKASPSNLTQRYGQELKVIYQGQSDDVLVRYFHETKFWNYHLQPLWTDGPNMEEAVATIHRLGAHGVPYELSIQAHKFMGVR